VTERDGYKRCFDCGAVKPLDEFHRDRSARDGRRRRCKTCVSGYGRRYYLRNAEAIKAYNLQHYYDNDAPKESRRKYRLANPEKGGLTPYRVAYRAVRRANEENAFDEYVDRKVVWYLYGMMCGICWQPVTFEEMHVDHIIPLSKGGRHSYKNVQASHPACNLKKACKVLERG
jgi:5-methylcytosine-specific restriction endonuclease McrA